MKYQKAAYCAVDYFHLILNKLMSYAFYFFFNITSSAWLAINTFKHFGIAVATIAFIRFLAL